MPDDAFHLPRSSSSKVIIEQIASRKFGIIADQCLENLIPALEYPVTNDATVVKMDMRIDQSRAARRM